MENNLFEELQEQKRKLADLATQAVEFGWIPKQKSDAKDKLKGVISLEEIKEKLEKDTLTIGVIGQMKCGKSTFLNAFVFQDDILPAATTPMTAALSIITYGEKERVVAEFYTQDEWAEQQLQASKDENAVSNTLEQSKIKAAKELVSKASKLGSSLQSYLGKTQEDSFENLIEYVGADGKYVSITKSVKIYYPKDYLKGVEVVDTPGFNDPIVSREERTKEFLKKADVVVMMLYAGRPFDATDRDIIFKNVQQCGIGKIIVGINKYDIPYENGEMEDKIVAYVKGEIDKACRECQDDSLKNIIREVEPIPLSAEMALLAEMPMSKISDTERFSFAWKKHCDTFEISSQPQMYQKSHLDNFVAEVKKMINNEKGKILIAKPLNAIMAAGMSVQSDNESALTALKGTIDILSMPDTELEDKEQSLNKANRRVEKKIDSFEEDIDSESRSIVNSRVEELEKIVDSTCGRLRTIVDNWGFRDSVEYLNQRLENESTNLEVDLKRTSKKIAETAERKFKSVIEDFCVSISDVISKLFPDEDVRDITKSVASKMIMEVQEGNIYVGNDETKYECPSTAKTITEGLIGGAVGFAFGLIGVAGTYLYGRSSEHKTIKSSVNSKINELLKNFDAGEYLQTAFAGNKDRLVSLARQYFVDKLITPMQQQIEDVRNHKADRENELQSATAQKKELEQKKSEIAKQIEDIQVLKNSLM